MIDTLQRWRATLGSFAGLAGLAWMSATLLSSRPAVDEHLAPEELSSAGTRRLALDGLSVTCREEGAAGPAVVLLHGFGGRLETWQHQQRALARRYRTVSLDLWGFGASARPSGLAPRDWTRQVFGVMDALGIDAAVLVGHSLGGRVALTCAAQAPERVRGLAVLDCDWGQSRHGYLLADLFSRSTVLSRLLARLRGNPKHVRRLMHIAYSHAFPITESHVMAHVHPLCVHGTSALFEQLCCAPPAEHDLSGVLPGVRCPVQVLWGAEDRIIPVEWAAPLVRQFSAASLAVISGAGHLPQEECPREVLAHLEPFIDRVTAAVAVT